MNELTKNEVNINTSPKIYGAIVNIMREIEAVPKAKKNVEQGFLYRSVDDVMVEVHDLMAKHGVFVIPSVVSVDDGQKTMKSGAVWTYVKQTIEFAFYATDGSFVTAKVRGEGLDSGDKGSNKALAVALKYALTQVFMIPTEDDKDPDAHTAPEVKASATRAPAQTISTAQMGKLGVLANKELGQSNLWLSQVIIKAFPGKKTLPELTKNEASALIQKLEDHAKKVNAGYGTATIGDPLKASEQQRKMIFAVAHAQGIASEEIKVETKNHYGLESFNDLTVDQARETIDRLQNSDGNNELDGIKEALEITPEQEGEITA